MHTLAELFEALKYRVGVDRHGTRRYYNDAGLLHRDDGPAVVWRSGSVQWWLNGQLHRDVGPAIEYVDGSSKEWWLHGVKHRDSGPAVIQRDGSKEWYQNGQRHRDGGNT